LEIFESLHLLKHLPKTKKVIYSFKEWG